MNEDVWLAKFEAELRRRTRRIFSRVPLAGCCFNGDDLPQPWVYKVRTLDGLNVHGVVNSALLCQSVLGPKECVGYFLTVDKLPTTQDAMTAATAPPRAGAG